MNIALVLAGGTGSRLGEKIPKQYIEVAGKPIIAYCLDTFMKHADIDKVQIVADEMWRSLIRKWVEKEANTKFQGFSVPGENRQLSIWNGLCDIMHFGQEEDVVIIHDAARPLVTERMITDCLDACRKYDGVLSALPVKDTLYLGENGKIMELLDRSKLIAGQTPEAFKLGLYYRANEALLPEKILKINGSTEPAVLAGMDIHCIMGEEQNFKITTREDMERFTQILMINGENE